MPKYPLTPKKYDEATGKLHMPCPHSGKSGIKLHIVLKDGYCYRSGDCMVFDCKYNRTQGDTYKVLSVLW